MPQTNIQTNTQTTHQGIDQRTKRPTSLISQGKLISYSYDVHGNIKTKTETPIDSKTGQALKQSSQNIIGYLSSLQLFYHPNNELAKSVKIEQQGFVITKTTTSYHYDAFGRRIAKNSKTQTLNKLNQNGKLVKYPTTLLHLRKTDKTTYQSTLMLWEGNRQLQEYTDQLIFTTVYDQDSFEPVSRLVQSRDKDCDDLKIYHYHNNHLGTPQELTDDYGNVVWANYEYAWGGRYTHHYNSQSLNGYDILEHELQPIRFQGQFFDTETSLHYNRFRYYDSDVGMFIQRDPIGLLGGINIYQYADNPVMWIDPFGLNRFKKTQWQAPISGTGQVYTVYQQNIDWNKIDKKGRTNLERALKGIAPLGNDGKSINLHHSKQDSRGSLFELSKTTHNRYDRTNALHPYKVNGLGKHPFYAVDRKLFGKDRRQYWIDRAKAEIRNRKKCIS
nr:RHS repeat-associated core domain-containing protein [Moraxella cuniculi]